MKVRVLETGEVVNAKRFKDMREEEIKHSTLDPNNWGREDLFIDRKSLGTSCMGYMLDDEVEIIPEESEESN